MNQLRARLERHISADLVAAVCREIEETIWAEANARYPSDLDYTDKRSNDARALGMYDAADIVKSARINHDPEQVPMVRVPTTTEETNDV